jgi:beta-lactamase superfamily II metal-dependent hydrolase
MMELLSLSRATTAEPHGSLSDWQIALISAFKPPTRKLMLSSASSLMFSGGQPGRPAQQEVEVAIFGPGFGESIVIHAGNNEWIIVDSCIDTRSGRASALTYLEEIAVDASTAVKLVVATHWHDDHIAGMSEVVRSCTSAKFACSAALTRQEFLELAAIYTNRPLSRAPSGPTEMFQTLATLKARRQYPIHAVADRPLLRVQRAAGGGFDWHVTALSPVDGELQRFLAGIAALLPQPSPPSTKSRLPNPRGNDISVAAWVQIGEIKILLGADLEEHGVAGRGWTAVLASGSRPQGTASVFKIAHHGSVNGHHDGVWAQLLIRDPIGVLTPWTLAGEVLPTSDDVRRINDFTPNGYCTSRLRAQGLQALSPVVRRTFRETGIVMRQVQPVDWLCSVTRIRGTCSANPVDDCCFN